MRRFRRRARHPRRRFFPQALKSTRPSPYDTIQTYENRIAAAPEDLTAYFDLIKIYSLVGDSIGALRILQKAQAVEYDNPRILWWMAKNRIWKGDINEGIQAYRQMLEIAPDNPALWAEAAKVAAWSGQYIPSLDLFFSGLALFPEDLGLLVNQALTYIWMGQEPTADNLLLDTEKLLESFPEKLIEMGRLLALNGYPLRALGVYDRGIERHPDYLDFYFQKSQVLSENRDLGNPEEVYILLKTIFAPSDRLDSAVELVQRKQKLKEEVIAGYEAQLMAEPDNLLLREVLVQTYFWNGMKQRAVEEYGSMLVNNAFLNLEDLALKNRELSHQLDDLHLLYFTLLQKNREAAALVPEIRKALSEYRGAKSAREKNPDDAAAGERLTAAEETVVGLLSRAEGLKSLWDKTVGLYRERRPGVADFLTKEEEEAAGFANLTQNLPWEWDWEFLSEELRGMTFREPVLANLVLGGYYRNRGQIGLAEQSLKAARERSDDPLLGAYGLYQTLLWQGKEEPRRALLGELGVDLENQVPGVSETEALAQGLIQEEGSFGFFLDDSPQQLEAALSPLQGLPQELEEIRTLLEEDLRSLKSVLSARTGRSVFFLSQQTAPLRFALGDYQLELGNNREAALQFEQLLMVDPWNISAIYKLGVVRQRYGDWYGAMKNYRNVYYQDPDYQNAVAYFNQLARENADTLSLQGITEVDNSIIAYRAKGSLQNRINSFIGLDLFYDVDVEKIYKNTPLDTAIPSSYMVQSLQAALPLRINLLGFGITPRVGGFLWTEDFNTDTNITGSTPFSLAEDLQAAPIYGVEGSWEVGPFSLFGGYLHTIKDDSIHRDRDLTTAERFEATFNSYFSFPQRAKLHLVSTRSYGKLEFLSDSNIIGQFVQSGVVGFLLNKDPQLQIQLDGTFNFEHAKNGSEGNYYAPDAVLEAKAGVRGVLNFHNRDYSRIWEISLWGAGGGFWEGNGGTAFKTEGLFSLVYSRAGGNLLFHTNIYGSGSFDPSGGWANTYWQLAATVGATVKVPTLLAD